MLPKGNTMRKQHFFYKREKPMRKYSYPIWWEKLEERKLLSVNVVVVGATMIINGDDRPQIVYISDVYMPPVDVATRVSVDANGDGDFTDPGELNSQAYTGIRNFVLNLRGGDDQVRFNIDVYNSVKKTLNVDLGNGNNTFSFGFGLSQWLQSSSMEINLHSGNGNDRVSLNMNDIKSSSTLKINMDLGGGDDYLYGDWFGDVAGGSTFIMNANLGSGNDTFSGQLDYEGWDIFGAGSTMSLNVYGGNGNDSLTMWAGNADVAWSAYIEGYMNVALNGGVGDDTLNLNLPAVRINGGKVMLREYGGAGKDNLNVLFGALGTSSVGSFDIALWGGSKDDVLTADVSDLSGNITYAHGVVLLDGGAGHNTGSTAGNAPFLLRHL